MSRCAVLGPGGVGGLLAVLLTDAGHEVVVVARTSSVETLRESGFHLSSPVFGERVTRPDVVDRLDRDDDAVLVATKATAEVTSLACAEGGPCDPAPTLAAFRSFGPGTKSSMLRDAEAGNPLELDAIGGAVVRAAQTHGIPNRAPRRSSTSSRPPELLGPHPSREPGERRRCWTPRTSRSSATA